MDLNWHVGMSKSFFTVVLSLLFHGHTNLFFFHLPTVFYKLLHHHYYDGCKALLDKIEKKSSQVSLLKLFSERRPGLKYKFQHFYHHGTVKAAQSFTKALARSNTVNFNSVKQLK